MPNEHLEIIKAKKCIYCGEEVAFENNTSNILFIVGRGVITESENVEDFVEVDIGDVVGFEHKVCDSKTDLTVSVFNRISKQIWGQLTKWTETNLDGIDQIAKDYNIDPRVSDELRWHCGEIEIDLNKMLNNKG